MIDPEKTPDPRFTVPDLTEAVEGWRCWKVSTVVPPFGMPPKLYSVTHGDYYWTPRRASLAECSRCGEETPRTACSCGFYSARTFEHLMGLGYQQYDTDSGLCVVVGKVANWGNVVECATGWRAAKSYPVHLYVPFEMAKLAKALKEGYGVPVSLKNWLKPHRKVW